MGDLSGTKLPMPEVTKRPLSKRSTGMRDGWKYEKEKKKKRSPR
jgi:hypothetical protein